MNVNNKFVDLEAPDQNISSNTYYRKAHTVVISIIIINFIKILIYGTVIMCIRCF